MTSPSEATPFAMKLPLLTRTAWSNAIRRASTRRSSSASIIHITPAPDTGKPASGCPTRTRPVILASAGSIRSSRPPAAAQSSPSPEDLAGVDVAGPDGAAGHREVASPGDQRRVGRDPQIAAGGRRVVGAEVRQHDERQGGHRHDGGRGQGGGPGGIPAQGVGEPADRAPSRVALGGVAELQAE